MVGRNEANRLVRRRRKKVRVGREGEGEEE